MIYPNFINKNSCIGVPAPSDGASDDKYKNKFIKAKDYLESIGYRLILSNNLYNSVNGRSSSAIDRANEVNAMFLSKDIDMIMCACGGDFLIEILPYIDFSLLKDNPKYVCGFSDPTGLLYPITTKYDIATIYGHNFGSFGKDVIHNSNIDFLDIVNGNKLSEESYLQYEEEPYERVTGCEGYNLTQEVYWHTLNDKSVVFSGRIIGGCFDVIANLAGTKYDGINEFNERYSQDGIIWYFDNCELSMEEVIRVLWKMNELNYFKYTKGIIFGRFGVNNSYYNYNVRNCLMDSVIYKLDIPIVYDADISHKGPTLTIINGSIATVNVTDGKGNISFKLE